MRYNHYSIPIQCCVLNIFTNLLQALKWLCKITNIIDNVRRIYLYPAYLDVSGIILQISAFLYHHLGNIHKVLSGLGRLRETETNLKCRCQQRERNWRVGEELVLIKTCHHKIPIAVMLRLTITTCTWKLVTVSNKGRWPSHQLMHGRIQGDRYTWELAACLIQTSQINTPVVLLKWLHTNDVQISIKIKEIYCMQVCVCVCIKCHCAKV